MGMKNRFVGHRFLKAKNRISD